MKRRKLGSTGLDASAVALGCGNFGGVGSAPEFFGRGESEEQAHELLDTALDLGVDVLDTADAYGGGRSETYIGSWLKRKGSGVRDRLLVSSKVFHSVEGDATDRGLSRARILRQVEGSLRRLGVEHLDLYLIHEPDPRTPVDETLGALDELVRSGKVRFIGASNMTVEALREALGVSSERGSARFDWVQNSFSLLDRGDEEQLVPLCAEQGLGYTPFGPLAGGFLTGKYRFDADYPAGSRMTMRPEPYLRWWTAETFAGIDRLREEALARGVSLPGLALAWVLSRPFVSFAIVGPRRPAHLEPVREALGLRLDEAECARLADLVLPESGEAAP